MRLDFNIWQRLVLGAGALLLLMLVALGVYPSDGFPFLPIIGSIALAVLALKTKTRQPGQ